MSRRARALGLRSTRRSAVALAGGALAALAPSSALALVAPAPTLSVPAVTPAPAASWIITWAPVPPDTRLGVVSYQYCVGAAACVPATPTAAAAAIVGPLADGAYQFRVRAIETVGLAQTVGPIGSVSFARDSVVAAPAITGGPANGARVSAPPTYAITGEAGATIAWSFTRTGGGTQAGSGASAAFAGANADGTWTLTARQTDAAGNLSTAATRTFVYDSTAPVGVAFSPQPPAVTSTPAAIAITGGATAGDPVTYRYSTNGGATFQTGASINLPGFGDGTYALRAFAVDSAGNQSAQIAATVTIDRSAPQPPRINGALADAAFTATVPSYTLEAPGEPATTTLLWSLDGPTTRPETSGPVNLGALTDGPYTLRARARDAAGNVSGSATRTFTLDRVRPSAPTLTPDIGAVVNAAPVVTLAGGGETGVTYRWQLDTGAAQTGPRADLTSGLAAGAHTFSAWTVDRAGNESTRATRAFRFDPAAPDAPEIAGVSPALQRAPQATMTGPARSTIVWTLEGPRNLSGEGPSPLTPSLGSLPDGSYTLQAFSRTTTGARSATGRATFRVDSVAPGAPLVQTGPRSSRGGPRPQFSWTGEQGATFAWQVQRNDLVVQGPTKTAALVDRVALLGPGSYSFRVSQTDAAGNAGPLSAPWRFRIRDRKPLRVVIAGILTTKRVLVKPVGPLRPKAGRVVGFGTDAKIAWVYRAGRPAQAFNVQVFDEGGKKVLSQFPTKSTFMIPKRLLRPGRRVYWQIWPYWGPGLGYPKKPLGVSYLDVRPSAAQIRAARVAKGRDR